MSTTTVLESQQDEAKLRYSRQLEVLLVANQLIASGETLETVISSILNNLLNIIGFSAAQVYQLSPSNNDLWLYLECGSGTKPVTQNTDIFSVEEENIISDSIRRGALIHIPNIYEGPYSYYGQTEIDTAMGSEVAIPLKYTQDFLGVLRVQSNTPGTFNDTDINFLSNLANIMATTIKNNRTIQQLENNLQEIKILYSLQHEKGLTPQRPGHSTKSTSGYQYDKTQVSKTDDLPPSVKSVLTQDQTGISTIQADNNKELVAPIRLHGETIGVLGIEDIINGERWTTDDINLLEEVSSQVALAVENSHLLQQTQKRTKELSILFEATRQLTETVDLNQIYEILTTQTINYLNADRCSALLLNKARTHFEVLVEKSRSADNRLVNKNGSRVEAVEDFTALQTILRQPDLIIEHLDDPELDPNARKFMKRKAGQDVYTFTRFPLVVRNSLVGIMEVEHLYQRRDYTKNELQLAQAIISQVTVAVENAQLFQKTQTALLDTQKFYEISRDLVESTDVDDIFNIVLENVRAYEVDRISISLLDRSKSGEIETVTIVATWDRNPDKISPVGTKFSAANFSLIHAFAQPPFHPLISQDLRQPTGQDERMDEAFRTFVVEQLEAVTLFSSPMFLGAEYKGVLSLYTRKPHVYTDQEIRVYQTLADQAIIAIENHRLLETTRRERDRASLLYQLGQKLGYTTTIDEVTEAVIEFTKQAGAVHTEIYIADGDEFISIASTILERQSLSSFELTDFREAEILAAGQQEKLIINKDTTQDEWPLEGLASLAQVKTLVSIPFYSRRSTLRGVLNFFHTEAEAFSEKQLATFDSITIQTAAALENVWLLRQTNIVLNETELLYKVTTGFNSAQSAHDLLMVLVDNLAPTTGVEAMAIGLIPTLDNQGLPDTLEISAYWNEQTEGIIDLGMVFTPDQFSFVQQLLPDAPYEISYNQLDPNTQTNINKFLNGVHTILSIPLAVGRNWLGVLLLASQRDDFLFKATTINQISTLAGQAAVVIQNLQLVEETQQNLYNSEILSSLGQQLLKADTVETIYDLTLSAISGTEPDRGIAIFMYNQIEGIIDIELTGLWDNPNQDWPAISTGSRFSTKDLGLVPLLKTGKTLTSNKASEDDRFLPQLKQLLMMMQINVMVAVPLWINQEVGGFILISNKTDKQFPIETIRIYEDIAVEVSGALENRRLFDEAQYRAWQLQTAAEISQAATAFLDLDTLLFQSVGLIRDRFEFYHVSIFMVDEYQRYAVVRASTGEIGQQMLEMNHKLEVGGKSIVGTATGTAKPSIALDVGKDAIHFNNPLLPHTRSEMALPLIAQGQVIGALDVQSTKQGAFNESDITILQSMANQLANAIEAARAFQKSSEALDEVSKLHQHYLLGQWDSYLKGRQETIPGYCLTEHGLEAKSEVDSTTLSAQINRINEAQQTIIISPKNGDDKVEIRQTENSKTHSSDPSATSPSQTEKTDDVSTLIAPLMLDGRAVIGTVDFEIPDKNVDTVSNEDTLKIIEAVTSQAAQAIESARLFEQTQISREEAEALYEVGRILVAAEDEQEMFNTVLGKMLSTLGLQQGGILFFNDQGKTGSLHALFENGKPVQNPNLSFPIEGNLSYQKLIETKRPVAIEDIASDPLVATVREINLSRGIASLLLVPIIINDNVIGAIGADSIGKKHSFAEREINLAVAMADQLSITLQNHRLVEETSKRSVLLQISSDVGRVATTHLNQDEMLDEAVDLIKERFGFYHVQIFLIDEPEQFAVLYKSTGEAGNKLLATKHKVAVGSQSVIGQVTYQRKPIVVRNTDSSNPVSRHHRNEFLPDTQAELAIPLQVGETLIGALDVQSTLPNAFTDEEISTLETLTAQLAIAIQNARAFKEQQETAERLKEIDKLKTQFLANMSHELRTPLNSIIGFSRVILKGIDGPLTELQKADLTSIHNSGQHLLGLINNILDLSKIEAGKMELNFEEIEVEPIIKTVMSTALALVKDKNVELKQEVPNTLPTIWADPTRVRQIVLNLVSNACKFTEEGTVTARVRADNKKVIFSVTDTGIGIPKEKMGQVFDEFTQVDASTTRKVGGTGLGLPISRHFVEMHSGRIWVESMPGQGSTFSFYVPIKPFKEKEITPQDDLLADYEPNQDDKKLVIAIDNDSGVITLYKRFLEKQNYEVIGLKHNQIVISQIKAYNPFAILLDVISPEQDGWSVIKELKDDPFTKDIPVIICSIVSDKNRGFSLGATNYLIKPIVEDELVEALKHLDAQQKEEVKVLVVDDQADDILLIRRILEAQPNYSIFEASNGKEGLELVENKEPDLIILDLNMPEMNGFAMVEALKENEKTRSIPIIIVSAQELTPEEHKRLTGQVEVLLHKGIFTENELLQDVSQALEQIRREEKIII